MFESFGPTEFVVIGVGLFLLVSFFGKKQKTANGEPVVRAARASSASRGLDADDADEMIEAVIGDAATLLENESACEVTIEGNRILLAKSKGEYFATSAKCPHLGAPLVKGVVSDGRVKCPWHGACFDLGSGDIEDFPCSDGLHSFPVKVEDRQVVIQARRSDLAGKKRVPSMVPAQRRNKDVTVIVGAGPGGQAAAESLRHFGYTGTILLIGAEPDRPYDRTKLSKAMSSAPERIALRAPEFYVENAIELMTSHEVTSLDPEAKTLELATGKTISFDNVVIATGGTPRSLPIPNFASPNVYQLRVPAEANAIYEQAKGARVVIVGSSFIGMEAAAAVVARAKSVTVIGMEKQPFERVLGPQVGAAMRKLHESKGVDFHMEAVVKEFQVESEGGPVVRALLSTGAVLEGDLFVVGAGVVPTTGFIKETGGIKKERDQSIMVDTRMRTAAPGVYVVGDIARFPYHAVGFDTIRVEHYGTAQQQGHIAGSNIAQGDKGLVYENVPFFWTQVFGKSIRYAGHAFMFTDTHVVGNVDGLDFMVVYGKEGRVDAVVTAGRDPQAAAAAELLRRGLMPKFDELVAAGDSIDFCAIIKEAGM